MGLKQNRRTLFKNIALGISAVIAALAISFAKKMMMNKISC